MSAPRPAFLFILCVLSVSLVLACRSATLQYAEVPGVRSIQLGPDESAVVFLLVDPIFNSVAVFDGKAFLTLLSSDYAEERASKWHEARQSLVQVNRSKSRTMRPDGSSGSPTTLAGKPCSPTTRPMST